MQLKKELEQINLYITITEMSALVKNLLRILTQIKYSSVKNMHSDVINYPSYSFSVINFPRTIVPFTHV